MYPKHLIARVSVEDITVVVHSFLELHEDEAKIHTAYYQCASNKDALRLAGMLNEV